MVRLVTAVRKLSTIPMPGTVYIGTRVMTRCEWVYVINCCHYNELVCCQHIGQMNIPHRSHKQHCYFRILEIDKLVEVTLCLTAFTHTITKIAYIRLSKAYRSLDLFLIFNVCQNTIPFKWKKDCSCCVNHSGAETRIFRDRNANTMAGCWWL